MIRNSALYVNFGGQHKTTIDYNKGMTFSPLMSAATGAMVRMFSQDCQLCGVAANGVICVDCARELPFRAEPGCPCCGESGSAGQLCGACLAVPPYFDATVSAFRYEFPLDRLLQAYKFRANLALTGMLADALAAQVQRHWADSGGARPDLIMPMPLAARRLAERGFNQSALLGRALAERFNLRYAASGLARVRDTRPQTGLKRVERQQNVKNAFTFNPGQQDVSGLRIALVDDVMTTGATMSEAARALKKAGASAVDAWAVARALQHR